MEPRNPSPPQRRSRAVLRAPAWIAVALALAGCGGGMEGVYVNRAGCGQLEFQRDGTVYVTVYGGTFVGSYEVDDTRVIVEGPNGAQVYTRSGDRLEGGFGTVFIRRPTGAGVGQPLDAVPDPSETHGALELPCDDDRAAQAHHPETTRGVPS